MALELELLFDRWLHCISMAYAHIYMFAVLLLDLINALTSAGESISCF